MAPLKYTFFWIFLLHTVVDGSLLFAQLLRFEEARELYLSRNPAVKAERERIEMARGESLQQSLRPNPQLNYSQEGFRAREGATFLDDQEILLWASQKLELGGKRRFRTETGRRGVEVAQAEFDDFLRQATSRLKEVFARVYFAQKKRDLASQDFASYREIQANHARRREAGDVSGLAQLRIDLEEIRFLRVAGEADADFVAAWAELSALIGWSGTQMPTLEWNPQTSLPQLSIEELGALANEKRPDLQALIFQRAQMETKVQLEEARRVPDLTLGGGYKRDFGVNSFYAAIQIPLPLIDRNQGAIFQAQAARHRIDYQLAWKRLEIRSEVERAYRSYESWQGHVKRLQEDTLVRADRMLETTFQSYREGEAGLTDYLDTLRVRLDVSLSFYDLLFQLQRAFIELERAVGSDLK